MSEEAQLTALCERLGASAGQAQTMARQLMKRADQLADTRGITRVEAMAHLLELVTKGVRGETPAGFEGVDVRAAAPKPVDPSEREQTVLALPMQEKLRALFRDTFGREPEVIARAPGRIEFIGNHTDYNGGTVLGAAVDRGIWVAAAARTDKQRRLFSRIGGEIVTHSGELVPVTGSHNWVNYPLGVLHALTHFGLRVPEGFDYVAESDLPTGAGLSSSAAIELASALAFIRLTGQEVPRETLVKIGRYAENHFVGVPCGILDQGVSGFGQKDHLVFIDCRGPSFSTVPMPSGTHFWIFNTHTKHALVDGLYAARHRECMEAAKALGVELLADGTLAQLEAAKEALSDVAFRRARHVIEEIGRVDATREALRRSDLQAVGAALTASHRSSQHLFENSTPELDFLVDRLVETPDVLGARLTGGGFGGAVMAFTTEQFSSAAADTVAGKYREAFGSAPDVLHMQTGPGADVVVG